MSNRSSHGGKKKRRGSHLMKSVEVRYSSSSPMDEIEPARDDYIYRWEINFNVQLSSPCKQLDRLDFYCWNLAHPAQRPPTIRRFLLLMFIFFTLAPVSQLASYTGRSDTITAVLYLNTNKQPEKMALQASLIGHHFFFHLMQTGFGKSFLKALWALFPRWH